MHIAPTGILGVSFGKSGRDATQLGVQLRFGHPGAYARYDGKKPRTPRPANVVRPEEREWNPAVDRLVCRVAKPRRHDTDYLKRLAVERNRTSNDRRVRTEPPRPEPVTHHNRSILTGYVLIRSQHPA